MRVKNAGKILIVLILIIVISGCDYSDFTNGKGDSVNDANDIVNDNSIKTDEMNIGNRKCLEIKDNEIYYIDTSDKNRLYMTDNQLKNKKLICDKYVLEIISVTDDEIYFVEVTENEEKSRLYNICSVNIIEGSYNLVVKDVISAVFLNNNFYYYRLTDKIANEVGTEFANFCSFNLNSKEEKILDEKTVISKSPILYKNKVYYNAANDKYIEYNPYTEEKRALNIDIEFFYRFSDGNVYAYKGSSIKKTNLSDNSKILIMPETDEIYNIWEMNVTKDHIFFLAQDTKEVNEGLYRLNLYQMNKDGSELKKIYFSDYSKNIISTEHFIYDIGNKILLYERNKENNLVDRNKLQLIDYEGSEIDSFIVNINI